MSVRVRSGAAGAVTVLWTLPVRPVSDAEGAELMECGCAGGLSVLFYEGCVKGEPYEGAWDELSALQQMAVFREAAEFVFGDEDVEIVIHGAADA